MLLAVVCLERALIKKSCEIVIQAILVELSSIGELPATNVQVTSIPKEKKHRPWHFLHQHSLF